MKKISITGARGTIGQILVNHLHKEYHITPLARPEIDVTDYSKLQSITLNQDILIHLAQVRGVSWKNENYSPDDLTTTYNCYKAALENRIPRVIMASSIHADDYINRVGGELKNPLLLPYPDSPYGAYKVYMEALGRFYATKGLEVICIRFGGVNPENKKTMEDEANYDRVYLSHNDLVQLIRTCIEIPKIPNNFELIYGVSNNKRRIHDWRNNLGWIPKDVA